MDRTYGLTHLQIAVSNMERSLNFYQKVFGLVERFRLGDDFVMIGSPGAHDILTLNSEPTDVPLGSTGSIAHWGFRVRTPEFFADVLRDAKALGGELLREGQRGAPGQRECYAMVRDPDGYEVEVFADIAG